MPEGVLKWESPMPRAWEGIPFAHFKNTRISQFLNMKNYYALNMFITYISELKSLMNTYCGHWLPCFVTYSGYVPVRYKWVCSHALV
jgi:hypothetical protein